MVPISRNNEPAVVMLERKRKRLKEFVFDQPSLNRCRIQYDDVWKVNSNSSNDNTVIMKNDVACEANTKITNVKSIYPMTTFKNQLGISYLLHDQIDEAEKCFYEALRELAIRDDDNKSQHSELLRLLSQNDLEDTLKNQDILPPFRSRNTNQQLILSLSHIVSNSKTCNLYTQQYTNHLDDGCANYSHHDSDEGMNKFLDPLPMEQEQLRYDGTDCIYEKVILTFNIGLTYCRRKNFATAIQLLHIAYTSLIVLTQRYDDDDSSMNQVVRNHARIQIIYMKILHTFGICQYRLEKYSEAVSYFEQSLCHIDMTSNMALEYIASTKNAIGISLFHSCAAYCSSKNTSKFNTSTINIQRSNAMRLLKESLEIYTTRLSSDTDYYNNHFNIRYNELSIVWNNIGRVYYSQRDYRNALYAFEASLKIRRRWIILAWSNPSDATTNLLNVVCNLGQTYHKLYMFDEAIAMYSEFLQLIKKQQQHDRSKSIETENADHPCIISSYYHRGDAVMVLTRMASIEHDRGCYDDARKLYEAALTSGRIAFRSNLLQIAPILNKLGSLCYKLGDLDMAFKYLQEGYTIEKLFYGSKHPNMVVTLLNMAQIHRDKENYSSAFSVYKHVYQIQLSKQRQVAGLKSSEKSSSLEIAQTLFNMGLMMHRMKLFSSAFEYYQQALYMQLQHSSATKKGSNCEDEDNGTLEIAATLNSMGIALFHLGRKDDSKVYFERSLAIRRKLLGLFHVDVPVTLFNLAVYHLESGDEHTAATMLHETLAIERKLLGEQCVESIQTLQHLGLAYQLRGELEDALIYFYDALDIERMRSGNNHLLVGKLLNLIGNIHLQRGHATKMMDCYVEASRIYASRNEPFAIAGYNLYCLSKLHPECAGAA